MISPGGMYQSEWLQNSFYETGIMGGFKSVKIKIIHFIQIKRSLSSLLTSIFIGLINIDPIIAALDDIDPGFTFVSFFAFIRRFWNQILICRSVKPSECAISIRRRRVRYRLKWNSFSSSNVWYRVYVCRVLFGPWPESRTLRGGKMGGKIQNKID